MVLLSDAAAARDDRAFLSGLVPDAVDRPAAFPCLELLDFRFLHGVAARALSQNVEAHDPLHALRHGRRHRPFGAQRQAVLEAHRRHETEFARTPKFNIEGQTGTWRKKSTATGPAGCPMPKSLWASTSPATIVYAIQNENYATSPSCFSSSGVTSTPA